MAEFAPSFDEMIQKEGGYKLTNITGDTGGRTYAGISQRYHPKWAGWPLVDADPENAQLPTLVNEFYKKEFWDKVRGDDIQSQKVASCIFDFAVNAGIPTASRLAQKVIDANADGIIGSKTLQKLNTFDEALFIAEYTLQKIARYAQICNKNSEQKKFLLGWINRALEGVDGISVR